ncbi:TetR/AcrR family transcriptional regulator [Corynebacterium breve]|uniref:TetR/AcrR family transcriptional regulator n=1 Tax=Corynebacterium breve TaxID=3049799 RepID=A0ABY8VF86_9CORY|nr:TetR/AcrR family transcriptional regulator [Corynebacterium breve]WIM67626.1 TetR/AcrR family transcriptional regulator [Corynebacterium breve]
MANIQRREQIAAAALTLFDQLGYHGTGMGDIAEAVGMRASSLYNHFGSKQELLAEVAISGMEEMLRANARSLAGVTAPQDKLATAMKTHVLFHTTRAQHARVVNTQIGNLEEPASNVVKQLRRDYVARWMSIVNEGTAAGIFHATDVKVACWALIDMGTGVSIWYAEGGKYTPEMLGDMYAEFALHQLGVTS